MTPSGRTEMVFFRDKKKTKKSWQQLSFKRKQTRDGALAAAQARSKRLTRLTLAVLFTAFVCAVIGLRQASVTSIGDWAALIGIVTLVHSVMFVVIRSQHKALLRHIPSYLFIVGLFIAVTRLLLDAGSPPLLVPVTCLAIVVAITFGGLLAIHTTLAACMLVALLERTSYGGSASTIDLNDFGPTLPVLFAQLIGAIVAIDGVQRLRTRTRLVVIGTVSGLAQMIAISLADWRAYEPFFGQFEWSLFFERTMWEPFPREPLLGLINGIGSGIIVTSALPFLEKMLRLTTDMRLQELADPNTPLLRDMSLVAPGSFNHSLMVSQLAQVAAQSIGANDLLARVGALYHDIGKMQKPNYFVENTSGDENHHDRLSPEMSRLIIISHVKDGIRMAEEEGLPRPIIDMIPMHHGTSVVEYFYQKKRQQESALDHSETGNEAFRYPGPKPSFREAGILMLADSVEAIARVLNDPTPSRLRALCRSVIDKKWADGQLDECELTIRELNKIEDAFVRVLAAIHHGRIKYPSQEKSSGQRRKSEKPVMIIEPEKKSDAPAASPATAPEAVVAGRRRGRE